MLCSYATKWIGGFLLMCATLSSRATLTTSLPRCWCDHKQDARHTKGEDAQPLFFALKTQPAPCLVLAIVHSRLHDTFPWQLVKR